MTMSDMTIPSPGDMNRPGPDGVEQAIGILQDRISNIDTLVSRMSNTLTPVLCPDLSVGEAVPPAPVGQVDQSDHSDIYCAIERSANILNGIGLRILHLTERLDLP